MSAFPGVSSYQSSSLGSKFVVIGVVCCQEMRGNALFHKVLRVLTKYLKIKNKIKINTPYSPPAGDAPADDPKPEDKPKPQTKRTRKKASVPTYAPERFEQFWQAYPGGGSRLKAVAAWDALAPSDELIDKMALALRRQMRSRMWQEGVGIPHASTWLNQQRWTDKLPEAPPAQTSGSGGWAPDPEVES